MREVTYDEDKRRSAKLCHLLAQHFPRARGLYGRLDLPSLSVALGLSRATAYRSLRAGKLSPRSARAIVTASRKKIALRDLYPFILS